MSNLPNSLALHEILLSISDSLNKAQNTLRGMPPLDEFGRPNTIYQLPYLDFNLEVISEFSAPTSAASTTPLPAPGSSLATRSAQLAQVSTGNYLKFVPFAATDYSKLSKNKITSVISGRFVAVLPNEGLPQVYMFCQATLVHAGGGVVTYRIAVRLQNATGNPLDGQRVEINFDRQNSSNISDVEILSTPVFDSAKDGFTGTGDTAGEFATTVHLDATEYYSPNRTFIFVANSGNVFSSVAISNPTP